MTEALQGWYYDGQTGVRRIVTASLEPGWLVIDDEERFSIADLEARAGGDRPAFGLKGKEGWRLGFDTALPDDWIAALPRPQRYGGLIDRIGLVPTIIGGVVASGLVLLALWSLPAMLALLVPYSWERKMGSAMVGDLGGKVCRSASGDEALAILAKKLEASDKPIDIQMVDIPMVNAVALPGGKIVIFKGLVDQATSADELAGVLAHEIGHIEHRHVMAGLIRQFGLGLFLSGSNSMASVAGTLMDARYSRKAEEQADDFSIERLKASHISTKATSTFFDRLSKENQIGGKDMENVFALLSSHPASSARRKLFADADAQIKDKQPALTPAQWQGLRSMCGTDKKAPANPKKR